MALPNLIPTNEQVQVQHTSFSVDALGRFVCSTWDEATANGGAPFSAIVIGAGMYGAYCAEKIYRRHPSKRVLLLDAGRLWCLNTFKTWRALGSTCPHRLPLRMTRVWLANSSGVSHGVATSISPDWPIARAASRCTGAGGVHD